MLYLHFVCLFTRCGRAFAKLTLDLSNLSEDANHWEKGDHSGARFDLCTVYEHIHPH